MCKRHTTSCQDHENAEYALNSVEMLALLSLGIGFDTPDNHRTDQRDTACDGDGHEIAILQSEIETHMFQSLENGHQSQRERRKKHIHRHIALRLRQRIVVVQDQSLHTKVNQIGDESGC